MLALAFKHLLSLTYKVLTTTHSQPSYLYNLITVQPHRSTSSSDVITLSHPSSSSSLKVNKHSFRHASPCLWNQLPKELCSPADHEDITLIWSLTRQFVISFITTVTIHYSSLPLQAQNSSFQQILSSTVLPFHPPDWLHRLGCFSFFSGMLVLTLALCARLSWLLVSF